MIIIERTITINNDQATLDKPIYFYVGDGNITCLFTIKEKAQTARFGKVSDRNVIEDESNTISYGEAKIYKPDEYLVDTNRAEIIDDKLQVDFNWDYMDNPAEAGRHQLQIHLYDSESEERNRITIPPVDIHVLLPIGTETTLIDKALVGYSLLDAPDEEVSAFDENGNYNMTVWEKGDIITKEKLNKLEEALHQVTTADDNFITNEGLEEALEGKADVVHEHNVSEIVDIADVAKTGSYDDLMNKPNLNDFATSSQLAYKADYSHQHSEYATWRELEGKANRNHNHSDYALKKDINIPTKVSQLENDEYYLTKNTIPSYYVTDEDLEDYKFATKNYVDGLQFATQGYVNQEILKAQLPEYDGEINLEGLATVDMIPVYTSDLINDSKFVKRSVLDDYTTTEDVNNIITERFGNAEFDINLDNYYTKDEMNDALADKAPVTHNHEGVYSLSDHNHDNRYILRGEINIPTKLGDLENDLGYITEEAVNEAIDSVNQNLTNNYALKEEIPTVPTNVSAFDNDANYITVETVNEAIVPVNEAISNINQDLEDNYAKKADIPTNVSAFTNDANYITEEAIPTNVSEFNNDAGYITSNKDDSGNYYITGIKIVDVLPELEEQEPGILYIVRV